MRDMDSYSTRPRCTTTMIAIAVLITCPVLFPAMNTSFTPVQAQAADWVIEKPGVTLDDQTMTTSKSIIVESGGGLIVRNSTIYFNLTKDGSQGIIVKAGGTLELYDSKVEAKFTNFAPTFESSGTLRMTGATVRYVWGNYQQGGGVLIKGGTAYISDSVFEKNRRQGVTVFDGAVGIQRSTFRDNMDGIMCKEIAGVLIEDTLFDKNTLHGILNINSVTTIRRNTFQNNDIAIGQSVSEATIKDNIFQTNRIGIDLSESSRTNIDGNKVRDSLDVGIRSLRTTMTIRNNEFSRNNIGLNVTGGTIVLVSNIFTENGDGILAIGAAGDLSDNVIGGSSRYGIYIIGGTLNVGTNDYNPVNAQGAVVWIWKYQVLVVKESNGEELGVKDAEVELYSKEGEIVFSGVTNATGHTKLFDVIERSKENTGVENVATPHKLKVKYKSMKSSKTVEVKMNQTTTVTLAKAEAKNPFTWQVILGIGLLMLAIAGGLFLNYYFRRDGEGDREQRIKRGASSRRRKGRGALTTTATSRIMRAKRKKGRRRR